MPKKLFPPKKRRRSAPPIKKVGGTRRNSGGPKRSKGGFSLKARLMALLTRMLKSKLFWKIVAGFTVIFALIILYFSYTLPSIDQLQTIKKQQGITITTEDGRVIANYGDVYGTYVPYDKLPKHLIEAVIATEDRRFFYHHGVDIWGILRAMMRNAIAGHVVQGGSTVTQQLAKNVFLTPDRTMSRKIQEVLLALSLEHHYSKKEIMAIYLNRVYLGSGTYGVDAAAHRYFNKSASDMNLAECAMIAGLLKAPSHYSPVANQQRAEGRITQVLKNMVDADYIKESDIKPALEEFKHAPAHDVGGGEARYFADWIMDQIPEVVGNSDEDLIVTTTMATTLQAAASDAVQNVIGTEGPSKNISQGALVAMTPDGAVKALVGGVNYSLSQYNRAAQAKRQPGSSFKLFVYLAGIEAGMTPMTMMSTAPITLQVGNKTWSPSNMHESDKDEVSLTEALRKSLNTVAVRVAETAGIDRVAAMAGRLGIPDVPAVPSIALGAVEATLVEMTGAYAHLPNQGHRVIPYGIIAVKTRDGHALYKREEVEQEQVLATSTVEQMNYMLLDVVRHGTGFKANLGARPAAGKTGTSQDYKDAWFIGFTPQLVAGVWVGNDDNTPMKKVTGGMVPAVIWHDFMLHAMEGMPAQPIPNRSDGGGLVPWLFGGNNGAPENTQQAASASVPEEVPARAMPNAAPATGAAPNALPFVNPAQIPANQSANNTANNTAPAQPVAATPAPANTTTTNSNTPAQDGTDPTALPAEFWHKLMDKVPPKDQLQYTYPSDRHTH